jgi:hypothetical protein
MDYERIFVVENYDRSAGLCVHMTYALNGIKYAVERNWLPVIRFDKSFDAFLDPEHGDNVWDYYFEPPMGYSYADIRALIDAGRLDPSRLVRYQDLAPDGMTPLKLQWALHSGREMFADFERIATFAYGEPGLSLDQLAGWMEARRALGRQYTARFIRVKRHVVDKVDSFYDRCMAGRRVVGVHIRGSDLSYALPSFPERYFEVLDPGLADDPNALVFVATDQQQYLEAFRERYRDRVLAFECSRSTDSTAPHLAGEKSPYQLGEEALIDCLLLARTQHLVKCAASAGEYALYFNPELECTDLGLESAWTHRTVEQQPMAAYDRWQRSQEGLTESLGRHARDLSRRAVGVIARARTGLRSLLSAPR